MLQYVMFWEAGFFFSLNIWVYASIKWTILYGGALYTSYVLGPCAFLSFFLLVNIFYFSINDKKKKVYAFQFADLSYIQFHDVVGWH